jgi:hypothetical protein
MSAEAGNPIRADHHNYEPMSQKLAPGARFWDIGKRTAARSDAPMSSGPVSRSGPDRLERLDLGPFQRVLVTRGAVMMGYAI